MRQRGLGFPVARLLDPKRKGDKAFPFEYRNSAKTDVRVTWARARKERERNAAEVLVKVRVFPKVKQ